jgi:fumarate hydratase class II
VGRRGKDRPHPSEDATPLTVGQEWSGYAGALDDAIAEVEHATRGLLKLAMGGTAVGTGLNAPAGLGHHVGTVMRIDALLRLRHLDFVSAIMSYTARTRRAAHQRSTSSHHQSKCTWYGGLGGPLPTCRWSSTAGRDGASRSGGRG